MLQEERETAICFCLRDIVWTSRCWIYKISTIYSSTILWFWWAELRSIKLVGQIFFPNLVLKIYLTVTWALQSVHRLLDRTPFCVFIEQTRYWTTCNLVWSIMKTVDHAVLTKHIYCVQSHVCLFQLNWDQHVSRSSWWVGTGLFLQEHTRVAKLEFLHQQRVLHGIFFPTAIAHVQHLHSSIIPSHT